MTGPTFVIPAKAGIQPWGHDEAGRKPAGRRRRRKPGKPWRPVIFWMLAVANASIQNTATAIRLAAFRRSRRLPGLCRRFVVSPRLDPRFRGDDTCWFGAP
jgi:hypothetical protein